LKKIESKVGELSGVKEWFMGPLFSDEGLSKDAEVDGKLKDAVYGLIAKGLLSAEFYEVPEKKVPETKAEEE